MVAVVLHHDQRIDLTKIFYSFYVNGWLFAWICQLHLRVCHGYLTARNGITSCLRYCSPQEKCCHKFATKYTSIIQRIKRVCVYGSCIQYMEIK